MINNWINGIVFILAPEEEEKISLVSNATDEIVDWLIFIFSYLPVKTELDKIISPGIRKPSCSDLLADANNSVVELEKPSFKQGHPKAIFRKYPFKRRFKI